MVRLAGCRYAHARGHGDGRCWIACASLVTFVLLTLLAGPSPAVAQPRACASVVLKNSPDDMEEALRNCTIIIGSLEILLMHNVSAEEWGRYQFPELLEVTDYVVMFFLEGLRSVGQLFPNLAVIRGTRLITQYSLVLFRLVDLHEIGLTRLVSITQGSVNIAHCRKLCHATDIDWKSILSKRDKLTYDGSGARECPKCADECNGKCWNDYTCFEKYDDKCHPECMGCRNGTRAEDCILCQNVRDYATKKCLPGCPSGKFEQVQSRQCVTEHECLTLIDDTYFTFNNSCTNACPPRYELEPALDSPISCRFCGSACEKLCPGGTVTSLDTAKALFKCTNITGDIILRVSDQITREALAENMGMIRHIAGSLMITRSPVITSLSFLSSLRTIKSNATFAISVLENQNLEDLGGLQELLESIEPAAVRFHYNPKLCVRTILELTSRLNITHNSDDVSATSNGDAAACEDFPLNVTEVSVSATNVTLEWPPVGGVTAYFLYYIDHMIEDKRTSCEYSEMSTVHTATNRITIDNLAPYSGYLFYIRLWIDGIVHQTPMSSFHTLSIDPSQPENVRVVSDRFDRITVSWRPPTVRNGVLSHYELMWHLEPDDEKFLEQRDFCRSPAKKGMPDGATLSTDGADNGNGTFSGTLAENGTCICKKHAVGDYLFELQTRDPFRDLCPYLHGTHSGNVAMGCKPYRYITEETGGNLIKRYSYGSPKTTEVRVLPRYTSFEVKDLQPYSMYVFFLAACNVNHTETPQCSEVIMEFNRTLPHPDADQIVNSFRVLVNDDTVTLTWSQPDIISSVLLTYEIDFNGTLPEKCLTNVQTRAANYLYQVRNVEPGKYKVRIRARSLAGPGKFTDHIHFEIKPEYSLSTLTYVILVVVLPFLLIVVAGIAWFWYKTRRNADNTRLITTVNPDYCESGPVYTVDQWEMERSDIQILDQLGGGNFGSVHTGYIKSLKKYCAVKMVNENSSMRDRHAFLQEASVMKAFDSHHVVKLIGVVSVAANNEPALVIMELMSRGDLKSFLHRSRDTSNTITSAEMYRMAIEIADGMAYLASKKFIHRDLAARNCMVSADTTVKIGDFGMARDIYFNDYYRKSTTGMLPVRWMAPESLADGVFTSDSDAWSYGIVLWEMATLAEQPYQGLANEQVLQFVTAHGKLERPPECPDLLYEIMARCWNWYPNSRPIFADIVQMLMTHVGGAFRLVSFFHSRDGEEYRMTNTERPYNPPALSMKYHKKGLFDDKVVDPEMELGQDDTVNYDSDDGRVTLFTSRPATSYLPMAGNRRYPSAFDDEYVDRSHFHNPSTSSNWK